MERWLREGAFEGETHIVTGAGQGIGNAVATALAAHGACVVMVDLDEGRLKEAAAEIATQAPVAPLTAVANVADEAQVKAAVATALEANGCINGVVNVAGITQLGYTNSLTDYRAKLAQQQGMLRAAADVGGAVAGGWAMRA